MPDEGSLGMLETELKFAIPDSFDVPSFERESTGVLDVRELPPLELEATYYDTRDLRLARNGITLRYRGGEGDWQPWSLKLPASKDGITRDEIHLPGVPDAVPEEIKGLVLAYTRREALLEVATIATRRRRWSMAGEDGRELAELVQDDVSVLEEGNVVGRFTELELEKRAADRAKLDDIASVLRGAGAMSAEPIPKAVRAIGPRATAPPDVPTRHTSGPNQAAGEAVRAALIAGTNRLLTNDPRARLGEPEGVHQVRVASRRLRSDLKTFSKLLEVSWVESVREELKWIAGVLGDVRDVDVMRERVTESAGDLMDSLGPLSVELAERHDLAMSEMNRALGGDRYVALIDELTRRAADPPLTELADEPSESVLPPLVGAAWKKLRKPARSLDLDDDERAFHGVRIRAKRLRYAGEAVAASLPEEIAKPTRSLAKSAREIQDYLGRHQDAVVVTELLRAVATKGQDVEFSLASGRIIERQVTEAAQMRSRFFDVWRDLDRKKNVSWLKT